MDEENITFKEIGKNILMGVLSIGALVFLGVVLYLWYIVALYIFVTWGPTPPYSALDALPVSLICIFSFAIVFGPLAFVLTIVERKRKIIRSR